MATINDGRSIDNGTAHMPVYLSNPALASEIYLDRMLGYLRAAESVRGDQRGVNRCLRAANRCLDDALNM